MPIAWSARKISADRSISRGRRPPFAEGELARRGHRSPSGQIRPRRAPLARAPRRRSRSFVPVCAVGSALPRAYAPWSLASSRASFIVVPSWIRTAIRRSHHRRNEAESKRCLGTARSRASCHRRCRHRRHRERQAELSRARTLRILSDVTPFSLHPHRGHLIPPRLRSRVAPSGPNVRDPVDRLRRVLARARLPPGYRSTLIEAGADFESASFVRGPRLPRKEKKSVKAVWVLVDPVRSSDRKDFRKIGSLVAPN